MSDQAISIKMSGFKEFVKAIDKGNQQAKNLYLRALDKSVKEGKAIMRKTAPYDTGKLRRSIDTKVDTAKLSGRIFTAEPYAPYLEFGTSSHAINGPVKIKGNWVYIKDHPGTKKQPFVEPTKDALKPLAMHNFKTAIDKYLQIIAK